MALNIVDVFGSGAILNGTSLTIPTDNLAVISGVSADYSNGAEAVFALLEHLGVNTPTPLSSGNITRSVSTVLVGADKLRKSYTFSFTVGDIELNSLDVQ